MNRSFKLPYPAHFIGPEALPVQLGHLPLERFQGAVSEFVTATNRSRDLGYLCALAALSAAMHSRTDMVTPFGRRPTSLFLLAIGCSSSGKSDAGEHFLKSIELFEQLRGDLLRGNPLIYNRTTSAALYKGMRELRSAILLSYEGRQLLDGVVSRETSELNAAWSGEPIRYATVQNGNIIIHDARVTLFATIHHGALDSFIRRSGGKFKDNGFLGRLLTVSGDDAGYFTHRSNARDQLFAKQQFDARIMELLDACYLATTSIEADKEIIGFSEDAEFAWMDYCNSRRMLAQEGAHFGFEPEHAMKLAENAARIAVLLHKFEGNCGPVSIETMWCAIALVELFSRHYMRNIASSGTLEGRVRQLDNWFDRHYRGRPVGPVQYILKSAIGNLGPPRLRPVAAHEEALEILEAEHRIRLIKRGKSTYIDLFPSSAV